MTTLTPIEIAGKDLRHFYWVEHEDSSGEQDAAMEALILQLLDE